MLRLRRYRVFVVFATISLVVLIHFSRVRYWTSTPPLSNKSSQQKIPPPPPAASPTKPPPLIYTKTADDGAGTHGFAPESTTTTVRSRIPVPAATTLSNLHPGDKTSVSNSRQTESPKLNSQKTRPSPLGEGEVGHQGEGRLDVDGFNRGNDRWEKQPEHFPVPPGKLIKLPQDPKRLPKVQFEFTNESEVAKRDRELKLAAVKESFNHSWTSYRALAWGHDELRPVYGGYRDPFSGWGATLVDALDTLWIMDMKEEFDEAVEAVKKIDFATSTRDDIPLFETVIRYLGGLLGAYDISGGKYQVLVDKAIELAEILMGAFDTPNRMPVTYYYWAPEYASQPHRASTRAVLAEIASLSLEFTRLAQITGEAKYYDAIARITNELEKFQEKTQLPGLWPTLIDASGCKMITTLTQQPGELPVDTVPPVLPKVSLPERQIQKREEIDPLFIDAQPADYNVKPGSHPLPNAVSKSSSSDDSSQGKPDIQSKIDCEPQDLTSSPNSPDQIFTLGGLADSAYEYLLKEYALLGGANNQYRTMYQKSMDTIRKNLLFRPMVPDKRDIVFVASASSKEPPAKKSDFKYKYEGSHLACFTGGMFALGAKLFGIQSDIEIASKLTDSCVWAYESTSTGIMPESFEMIACESLEPCEWNQTRYYDVLDPFEAYRRAQHEKSVSLKAQLIVDDTSSNSTGAEPEPQSAQPAPQPADVKKVDADKLAKRQVPGPAPAAAPSLRPRPATTPLDGPGEPKSLSHKEFAEEVIKEERLPPGFTSILSRKYILRPEAIESVFIMYRVTGDNSWREKGWKMFQAIKSATRTELANSAIKDVTSKAPMFMNEMESFWFAETLKYCYLLFSNPALVSLDEYVLNTEAHPLKRPLPQQH
ncbi:hypothetical protein PABG_04530 [Paracoccidioides brasiliensis Pb03]|nr:hypothetical protein PABG_04530 [Paracoccidioides brasiliensis Pb03]